VLHGEAMLWTEEGCWSSVDCVDDICWVRICGATFEMGDDYGALSNQAPLHTVEISTIDVMQSEATVAMYRRCVDDGACEESESSVLCDDLPDDRPRTCIDWERARQFCAWTGGRMLSEAEYEFASRSRGTESTYPWGDEPPDCDRARLGCDVCGTFETAPVCTHPTGDTEQGLCDMAGNAIEWTADWYHNSYVGAPTDGSAWLDPVGTYRVMRGGGVGSCAGPETRQRTFHEPEFWYGGGSVRCVRDVELD